MALGMLDCLSKFLNGSYYIWVIVVSAAKNNILKEGRNLGFVCSMASICGYFSGNFATNKIRYIVDQGCASVICPEIIDVVYDASIDLLKLLMSVRVFGGRMACKEQL